MSESTTAEIGNWIERLRAGDGSARAYLIDRASARLERLTRKMLKDYPGVRRWEQTGDVLNNSLIRLHRSLAESRPTSPLEFFRLAALQIRRELLDLARRYAGPEGLGANHASQPASPSICPALEPGDETYDPRRLAEWTRFHEVAGSLPAEEREVFDLLFYQGISQDEAASLLGVSTPDDQASLADGPAPRLRRPRRPLSPPEGPDRHRRSGMAIGRERA